MFLVSSNRRKLAEIEEFGLALDLKAGLDLPEVAGTPDEVACYKALAAGPGAVVEDTILVIDGEPVVDIRWRLAELNERHDLAAEWMVSLGHHAEHEIRLYRGVLTGRLQVPSAPPPPDAFGFDPYFVPEGETRSLHELAALGLKAHYSARRLAVEHLLRGQPDRVWTVASLPPWTGAYQNS